MATDSGVPGGNAFKESLRETLVEFARAKKRISYVELARKLGRDAQGPWPELDALSAAEIEAGRPDLTLIVIQRETGYPTRFRGHDFNTRNLDDLSEYGKALKAVFQHYPPEPKPKPVW